MNVVIYIFKFLIPGLPLLIYTHKEIYEIKIEVIMFFESHFFFFCFQFLNYFA